MDRQVRKRHMRDVISTQNEKIRKRNVSDQGTEAYEAPESRPGSKTCVGLARSELSRHDGTSMRVSVLACLRILNSPPGAELCLLLHGLVLNIR